MAQINTSYEDLLRKVLTEGTKKEDRTGTGTRSIFGAQLRFNLATEGFPIITTKKIHTKAIIHELLWFLQGTGDIRYLEEHGVKIWDAWRRPYNLLAREIVPIEVRKVDNPTLTTDVDLFTLTTVEHEISDYPVSVVEEWVRIMRTAYDPSCKYYNPGTTVTKEWHNLDTFYNDVQKLPHWRYKKDGLPLRLSLTHYHTNEHSLSTSVWLGDEEIEYNLSNNNRHNLIPAWDLGEIYGVQWRNWPDPYNPGHTIDQVQNVINDIKADPNSRRLIINGWNPAALPVQALPPCHTLYQFYVADNKLSLQLYQRSGDLFLGIPFNISSASLLLTMIAQQTGLEVGEFIHTIGDAHIYENHVAQVEEQLSREAKEFPTLTLNHKPTINDYVYDDVNIVGYDPHPLIKGAVAV